MITSPPEHIWVFPAALKRVVDGDTVDLVIDHGMHASRTERVRFLGVNAPEKRGPERVFGLEAMAWVQRWLDDAANASFFEPWPLRVRTVKDPDVFGRYLVDLWRISDGRSLNEDLVSTGHAVVYRPD